MEDISQLCKRIIIINLGEIIYDGYLNDLIKKYAPHKLLSITLNNGEIKKKQIEKYGKIYKFDRFKTVLRVDRDKIKNTIATILSSNLPVDDISVNEDDLDSVIRKIFQNK